VQAVPHRHRHQLVPGRVELHLVDPVPEAVVRVQHRRVLVGLAAESLNVGRARPAAELAHGFLGPAAALAPQRAEHGRIVGDVVARECGRLVEYVMCRRHQRFLPWRPGRPH
jgi:hypothetical protein